MASQELETFRLLDLSAELIVLIIQQLAQKRKDLINLASACHKLGSLCQPFLLFSITIRKEPDLQTLTALADYQDNRVRHVQRLTLVPTPQEKAERWKILLAHISRFTHLRHLHVETPFRYALNDDETEDSWTEWSTNILSLFDHHFFSQLQGCKLNFHNISGRLWELYNLHKILGFPRLQHLELVNVDFGYRRLQRSLAQSSVSKVKSLVLDNCRLTTASLDSMMSAPAQLEAFTWIERYRDVNVDEAVEIFQHLVACLARHRRSLRKLVLKFLGPRAFTALVRRHKLDFRSLSSLIHLDLWLSDFYPEDTESRRTFFELPCSLQTLKLCASKNDGSASSVKAIIRQQIKLKQRQSALRVISLSWCPLGTVDKHPVLPAMQIEISRLGAHLKASRNIQLRAYRRTKPRFAQPPYLYGEYVPEELLVYDSYCSQWHWDARAQVEIDDEVQAQKQAEEARMQDEINVLPDYSETDPQDLLLNQINNNNI